MIKLLRKLFARKNRKAKVVVPPVWPYNQSKRKMKGSWEIK